MYNSLVPFESVQFLNVEGTNACNLHCTRCSDNRTRKTGFMSLDLAEKILKQCHYNMEVRLFLSGEPLLHKNVAELATLSKKYVKHVLIHTNATLLTPEITEKLIVSGLTHISFSFDGTTRQEYENVRRGAKFEPTLENIKYFISQNKNKVHTTIQMIRPFPEGLNDNALRNLIPGANDYRVMHPHSWNIKGLVKDAKPVATYSVPCFFPWSYFSFLWTGEAVSCCADLQGDYIIGNANTTPIAEIWNSKEMVSIRERQINHLPILESCSKCERYCY